MKNLDQLPPLVRGDVLFYKTRKDGQQAGVANSGSFSNIDPADFDDLDVLCAYAQSLPYDLVHGTYRPWFHVSICSEGGADPKEIGFQQRLIKEGVFRFEQGRVDLPDLPFGEDSTSGRSPDVAIQVLRAPESGWDLDAVIHAGEEMINRNVQYAYSTLLTFALATVARTMPNSSARSNNMATARGSSAIAYRSGEQIEEYDIDATTPLSVVNCVTGAALMLNAGLTGEDDLLLLPEPPIPTGKPSRLDSDKYAQAIKDLLSHLLEIDPISMVGPLNEAEILDYHASLGVDDEFAAFDARARVRVSQARADWVAELVDAGVSPAVINERLRPDESWLKFLGAPISTPEYTTALGGVIGTFQKTSKQDLRDADHLGKQAAPNRVTELPPWNLIIGPAMLWEALTQRGWIEVTSVGRSSVA